MKRRTFRPFVYVLVALQLLLSVPVASAWAAEVSAEAPVTQAMSCDGMDMPEDATSLPADEHPSKHCGCCPDGATGTLDCRTACAAGAAMLPAANYFVPSPVAVSSVEPLPVIFHPLADPPLKPPPIA